jgi:pimeloyl-ACP methyl ester carboxylesterase
MTTALDPGLVGLREGYAKAPFGRLYYLDAGPLDAPPLLMIMGLGCQLTVWPEGLWRRLLDAGFRVIRFDNRDIGLSDAADRGLRPNTPLLMAASRLGVRPQANYSLYDMVEDSIALMDELQLRQIHLVGASMGGMISQLTAALFPQRVASLCSIMSTTNERHLPMPKWHVLAAINGIGMPQGDDLDTVLARGTRLWNMIGSPGIGESSEIRRDKIKRDFHRAYRPEGRLRHVQAIAVTGGFSSLLSRIDCPSLVMHGDRDPLVRLEGGLHSAASIPGAKLQVYRGMAHDLPPVLQEDIATRIAANARGAF